MGIYATLLGMKKKPLTITEFARMGGKASMQNRTKAERVAMAKKAAAARWKKAAKIAVVLLLFAGTAQAQEQPKPHLFADLAPYVVLIGGNVADVVTTQQCLQRIGCHELNQAFGQYPSATRLIVAKSISAGAMIVLMRVFETHGHPRLAKFMGYVGGGVTFAAAVHNTGVAR